MTFRTCTNERNRGIDRKCSSSTDHTANNTCTHCSSEGDKEEQNAKEKETEVIEIKGVRHTREKHQEWRATDGIVFRGNLQNVSFYREPNWFVIPFYRQPRAGVRGWRMRRSIIA